MRTPDSAVLKSGGSLHYSRVKCERTGRPFCRVRGNTHENLEQPLTPEMTRSKYGLIFETLAQDFTELLSSVNNEVMFFVLY